ncbi:hypothetical protein PLESTB_000855300 [Pleodorina starrii]|uniref:Peptidase M11 gametolysin domain-containing protein n=1 Tax=Pleodorina starrii TaxID=330485 RepID=A0A9W6F2M8_9CHLO|nr:hypothetical protein PLESTB_000855300 [Pleodorina starrii]
MDLNAGSFRPSANRFRFSIPASGTTDQNMVIVDVGSIPLPDAKVATISYSKYFLSYRLRNTTYGGYDSGLSDSYHQKVLLHSYNGTISDTSLPRSVYISAAGPKFDKVWDRTFPEGNVFTAPFVPYNASTNLGGGLRIKVVSVGGMSATVEVCRMYSETEGTPGSAACQENLDRDW